MDSRGARLRKRREERGYKSARAAAMAHGWTVSAYTHHENGTRDFDAETAEKYARAFGTSAAYLLFGDKERIGSPSDTKGVPVLGDVEIGVWRESTVDFMSQAAVKSLDIPMLQQMGAGRRFAVRVNDASVNKALRPGEFAVCVAIPRGRVSANDFAVGDLLLIERLRRGLKEMSIRRVSASDGGRLRLAAHSDDQRMTGEISYPSNGNVERITILAKVVGRYTDFTP